MKKRLTWLLTLLLALFLFLPHAGAETDMLTFALTKDGSGYEITGCMENASVVIIPAVHDGLPVKAVANRAFTRCRELKMFIVEQGSETFYAEDGVLFTDDPVKTLVRFPNNWKSNMLHAYQVPEGTEAIAPWAFSGFRSLAYLHIPEGVTTLGDYAFAESEEMTNLAVFAPDSLKTVGKNLTQNQVGNTIVFAKKNSALYKYAKGHKLACTECIPMEPQERTVELGSFDLTDAEETETPDPAERVYVQFEGVELYGPLLRRVYDLTSLQRIPHSEVYLALEKRWPSLLPDKKGKTSSGYPPVEGLYGIGWTEEPAVLRGYDAEGNVTGIRRVEGNFDFALPGALSLGVSGGSGTHLAIAPYEPIIVRSPGVLPLSADFFRQGDACSPFRGILVEYPSATRSISGPEYLNAISYSIVDAFDRQMSVSPHYAFLTLEMQDPYVLDEMDQVSIRFHVMEERFHNEELTFEASTYFENVEDDLGEKLYGVLTVLKSEAIGIYYPEGVPMNHVEVQLNGVFPTTELSVSADSVSLINLDEYCIPYKDNVNTYAHEMVHALDYSFPRAKELAPPAWMEGRAEYISDKVCKVMKTRGSGYPGRYNWSFLSEEDKADFFRYYYEQHGRETVYPVGYYFFKYLCDTYGEDVSAKIMANMENARFTEDTKAEVFKECVTSATDPDVFQNFVRDVIR